jgi:hypothetical protein
VNPPCDPAVIPGDEPGAEGRVDAPEEIPRRFVKAWNARDPDGIARLFAEDADFVNVVGIWWEDREAIRRAHAYGLERIFPDSRLRLGRVKVRRLSWGPSGSHSRSRSGSQSGSDSEDSPGSTSGGRSGGEAGDMAVVHARMTLENQAAVENVAAPGRRVTLFSFVVRRDAKGEGGWICVSAQNTDVVAGAETHVRDESTGELRPADYRD